MNLCEDLHNPASAEAPAGRVTAAFADPFHIAGQAHAIALSAVTAYAGPGEQISDQLVASA